jgi:hypothetical protein
MDLFEGPRLVASHRKAQGSLPKRITRKEHRPPRGKGPYTNKPSPEEEQLLAWGEPLKSYVRALKKRSRGRATVAFRRLVRLCRDYPRDPLLQAVQSAAHYGMYDLERLEKMILRIITTDFFILSRGENDHE